MTPNVMDSLDAKSQDALDHEHETARPGRSNPNNLRDQVAVNEGLKLWHTPGATDWKGSSQPGQLRRQLSEDVLLYPTPDVPNGGRGIPVDAEFRGNSAYTAGGRKVQIGLENAVKLLPTPSSAVVEPKSSVKKLTGRTPADPQVGLADVVGGQLNPDWVCWLQGVPIGWVSLEPLASPEILTWEVEPEDIPRVGHNIPARVDQLKMLGNGIVPECVALFLRGIA
jgi:hypothetical protein